MLKKVNVVVFDFDGTISASDSNYEFFKYCFKHSIRPWFYIPIVFAGWVVRGINPSTNWWREHIRRFVTPEMVRNFSNDVIKLHKKNRFGWAKEQIEKEKNAGNKVILISAGPNYLIPKLVSDIKFDAVLCSQMDVDKPYRYKFLCLGKNKVVAMDNWAKENKYIPNVVRAYSDSVNDKPIMEIARDQIWIDSKTGLRKS